METRRDVFQAIADPIRRQIIDMVMSRPLNLNTIAASFDVTRQAVSLHVKILAECGLLDIQQQGRERFCAAKPEALKEVAQWVSRYQSYWNERFDALDQYLQKTNPNQ